MTWHERIEAANVRGRFTPEDVVLASSWDTCICGGLDECMRRWSGGAPADDLLRVLGIEFTIAVRRGNTTVAERTLVEIESRVKELLHDPL